MAIAIQPGGRGTAQQGHTEWPGLGVSETSGGTADQSGHQRLPVCRCWTVRPSPPRQARMPAHSERQAEPELHTAGTYQRAGDLPEVDAAHIQTRRAELRVVPNVEHLPPEL